MDKRDVIKLIDRGLKEAANRNYKGVLSHYFSQYGEGAVGPMVTRKKVKKSELVRFHEWMEMHLDSPYDAPIKDTTAETLAMVDRYIEKVNNGHHN